MAKKKIIKDNEGNPVEIDQDVIDAALAGAVTTKDGTPIAPPPPQRQETVAAKENSPASDKKSNKKSAKKWDESKPKPIAADQKKFGEDCYNLNIDAKKCHYQSTKHEDKSILEYVRAINKKI